MCGGTGQFSFKSFIGKNRDVHLEVWTKGGQFYSATHRGRTWRHRVIKWNDGKKEVLKEWGKDLFCREILDREEARKLWAQVKANGGVCELTPCEVEVY